MRVNEEESQDETEHNYAEGMNADHFKFIQQQMLKNQVKDSFIEASLSNQFIFQ